MSRGNVELTHVAHDAHAVRYGRLLVGGDPFGYWALRMTVFTAPTRWQFERLSRLMNSIPTSVRQRVAH